MHRIISRMRAAVILILIGFVAYQVPVHAQMGGQGGMGGMGGGTMDGLISGRNGVNSTDGTVVRNQIVTLPGWGMMMSWDDREGMAMGMRAGPFIQGNTLYTLSPDRTDLSNRPANFVLLWKLSAYDLNGNKLWDVKLESDMIAAPVFAPDGKILLTGREGMVGMNGWSGSQSGGGNPSAIRSFSSSLYIITPNSAGASVFNVKLDGEWSSRPVSVNSGNSYLIYLTARTVNLSDWDPLPRPTSNPPQDSLSHQYIYAFDPDGNQKLKVELQ